jgi:hypothetical protein
MAVTRNDYRKGHWPSSAVRLSLPGLITPSTACSCQKTPRIKLKNRGQQGGSKDGKTHCFLLKMEPIVGFEPTTGNLQNCCSTPELNWQPLDWSMTLFRRHVKVWHWPCELIPVKKSAKCREARNHQQPAVNCSGSGGWLRRQNHNCGNSMPIINPTKTTKNPRSAKRLSMNKSAIESKNVMSIETPTIAPK